MVSEKSKIMYLKGMNGSKTLSVMSKKISRCQIMEQLLALLLQNFGFEVKENLLVPNSGTIARAPPPKLWP
jgi:hypothetical protein